MRVSNLTTFETTIFMSLRAIIILDKSKTRFTAILLTVKPCNSKLMSYDKNNKSGKQ